MFYAVRTEQYCILSELVEEREDFGITTASRTGDLAGDDHLPTLQAYNRYWSPGLSMLSRIKKKIETKERNCSPWLSFVRLSSL